jgi:hypothetical protein
LSRKDIPENIIEQVASAINERNNKIYPIPIIGNPNNSETPQIFEIISFDEIDDARFKYYAIDGSYNSQEFYNGLLLGLYTAGYICYYKGKQICLNDLNDPLMLGKSYFPDNILVTKDEHLFAIYDELLTFESVKKLLEFFNDSQDNVFAFKKDIICRSLSSLLSFSQEILEWSLILEISNLSDINKSDFILKDGSLRSNQIKQKYLVKLGNYLKEKEIILVGITKKSPIKMELSYTFKQIDSYLQSKLKCKYPFTIKEPKRQKLCCWFEVPETVLATSFSGDMYSRKDIIGGRGFGLFFVARLDYVEKLQNYDWVVADVNIFDAIPGIESRDLKRDMDKLNFIFKELTRLTQEHYILGYPYPLVEVHNFVSLKNDFKEEIIKRVKFALYMEQRMDNIDIENLFLDIHDMF